MRPATRFLTRIAVASLLPAATTITIGGLLLTSAFAQTVTTYTIPATAMPWQWESGGLNSSYPFGHPNGEPDGTGPVVVDVSGIQGQPITVTYASGTVTAQPGAFPYADAEGDTAIAIDNYIDRGLYYPSYYMSPYPIYLAELVGTFADSSGTIVGTPFALGDGPTSETVPQGATQLQLGVNDDIYSDNQGSWDIQVSVPQTSTPQIFMDGQNITGQTVTVAVGQKVMLTASTPEVAQTQLWSVPGHTVGGYNPSATACDAAVQCPSPTNFQVSPTTFFWADTGSGRVVTYSYTPSGVGVSATSIKSSATSASSASTTFNVVGPAFTMNRSIGLVGVTPDDYLGLNNSISDSHGIDFSVSISNPAGYSGDYHWTQVINYGYKFYLDPTFDHVCSVGPGLDNREIYRGDVSRPTFDRPSIGLNDEDILYSAGEEFTMYLMWDPKLLNSIPVPLASVTWGWLGSAEKRSGKWALSSDPELRFADPVRYSSDYPRWVEVVHNGKPFTCSSFPRGHK